MASKKKKFSKEEIHSANKKHKSIVRKMKGWKELA